MAGRVTVKNIEAVFRTFCRVYGLRIATAYDDVGAYAINRYMGYKVVQIVRGSEGGTGEGEPFGAHRYSAREFVDVLYFAIQVKQHFDYYRQVSPGGNPPRRRHRHQYAEFDR